MVYLQPSSSPPKTGSPENRVDFLGSSKAVPRKIALVPYVRHGNNEGQNRAVQGRRDRKERRDGIVREERLRSILERHTQVDPKGDTSCVENREKQQKEVPHSAELQMASF